MQVEDISAGAATATDRLRNDAGGIIAEGCDRFSGVDDGDIAASTTSGTSSTNVDAEIDRGIGFRCRQGRIDRTTAAATTTTYGLGVNAVGEVSVNRVGIINAGTD